MHPRGLDVRTYRRGPYTAWPEAAFAPVTGVVDDRPVAYTLAERPVDVVKGFRMREIRRLCDGGHQPAIVTARWDVAAEVVAYRMFERGPQENFFRYMRQHFALDALVTYAGEPADLERTVPNPQRTAVRTQRAESRAVLAARDQAYGQQARRNREGTRPTMRGFKIAHAALGRRMQGQEAQGQALRARIAALPERVPITAVVDEAEVVTLAPEAKHLTDTIKMVAYRAETTLVHSLAPHDARTEDEGRALIRELLVSSADIIPDRDTKCLRVRVHSLANPRSNEALTTLCETLNALQLPYPATDLPLVYEALAVA